MELNMIPLAVFLLSLITVCYSSDCSGLLVKHLDGEFEGKKYELKQPFELPAPSCGKAPLFIEEDAEGTARHLYYHHINKRWEIGMKRPLCNKKTISGDEPWLVSKITKRNSDSLEGETTWSLAYGASESKMTLHMECTQFSLGGDDDFIEKPNDEL